MFFWRPHEENGYLGNWHVQKMTMDGLEFVCSEQAMMYKKALLMGDVAKAKEILQEQKPANHKKLGQQVKPWDEEKWLKHREQIMFDCCKGEWEESNIC